MSKEAKLAKEREEKAAAFLKENKERSEALAKEYDVLLDELTEIKGMNQSYAKDSTIEIPGPLFASFINYVSYSKQTLEQINNSMTMFMNQMHNVVDVSLTDNVALTLEIIKEHIKQVKAGKTVDNSVIEKEDAEAKIKEIK